MDIPEFPEAANKEDSPSMVNVELWASFQKPVKHPEGIGEAKTGWNWGFLLFKSSKLRVPIGQDLKIEASGQ